MKDSGERDLYNGGAQRDKSAGKGRYDLISPIALFRLARVYEDGAVGKGERNWENGIPVKRYMESSIRHLFWHIGGMRNEDHLAQAAWNIFSAIHTEHQVLNGALPEELLKLPLYKGDICQNWNEIGAKKSEKVVDDDVEPRTKSFEEMRNDLCNL